MNESPLKDAGAKEGSPFPGKPIGIFARVAAARQPCKHLRSQLAGGRRLAEQRNWKVAREYLLKGVGANAVLRHSETQRMLSDVRSGRIKALIVSDFARLGRGTEELLKLCQTLRDHGTGIIFVERGIDTLTNVGHLAFIFMVAMAQREREAMAARSKAARLLRKNSIPLPK